VKIFINNEGHLKDFIRLNEEWITKYFELEDSDKKLAANPLKIIEEGGYVFSLVSEQVVVGACALFNEGDGTFELARMAVSPTHQGKGYSDLLMKEVFSTLKKIHAHKVYLVSNTLLAPAISLYKKHGFKTTATGKHPIYTRANVVMEMVL